MPSPPPLPPEEIVIPNEKREKAYGTWASPITSELITKRAKIVSDPQIAGAYLYWREMRPSEKGRYVVVRKRGDGVVEDLIPPGYSVRSRVHEYGGSSYCPCDDALYFVNFDDQRLYRLNGSDLRAITEPGTRFADLHAAPDGIVAVAERHGKGCEPINFLALIDPESGRVKELAKGDDFYASPTLSQDGKKIAWISWNHPDMPWDSSKLYSADIADGEAVNKRVVAFGENVSILQPGFSKEGKLYYISDETGWWNLYCYDGKKSENILPMQADFGEPLWSLGTKSWAFAGDKILCTYRLDGRAYLDLFDPKRRVRAQLAVYSEIDDLSAEGDLALIQVGKVDEALHIEKIDLSTGAVSFVTEPNRLDVESGYFSYAQFITFPSGGGRVAHGYFYPPINKEFKGKPGELPPLIVQNHGGPTSNATATFSAAVQFWTSRGFALLDVDYGGSSGYGRAFRELLKGNWGVVDVEDCRAGALYLVEKGLVDPDKLAIRGGSAGGYTALASLAFGSTFVAGASYYGVSDLTALLKDTHKFESRYPISLIGPYPEKRELYEKRSPIHHLQGFRAPVIFFQGEEDEIVPPNQAEMMAKALRERGVDTELILYPKEQHGFRDEKNIRDAMERELAFYKRVFRLQ